MNNFSRLVFVLKEGFAHLFRSKGLSTTVIVIVASTLLQLSIFLGISRVLDNALVSAKEKFEMAVFLTSAADTTDLARIKDTLSAEPQVASVKVVTKEEALQDFRKDPDIDRMVQALGENPLTDSISVVLKKDAAGNLDELVNRLKKDPSVEEVNYGKNEWEEVSNISRTVRWMGLFLGGFVFLTALFIITNTLSLSFWARKEDFILLSRMGAPTWMRWGPYLWEGVLQGILGTGLMVLILELIRHIVGMTLAQYGGLDILLHLPELDWWDLYLALAALGVILSFTGSFLALQSKWVKELK